MEIITRRFKTLHQALNTLHASIKFYDQSKKLANEQSNPNNAETFLAARDSVIQRFEYCTDLFWKFLKVYLQNREKIEIIINSPRGIIRQSVAAKIIMEKEGQDCMQMIEKRNATSHIYHQEIADQIVAEVPSFYHLMHAILDRLSESINEKK